MFHPSSLAKHRELPTISRNSQKIKKILDKSVMTEVAEANQAAGDAYLVNNSFDVVNINKPELQQHLNNQVYQDEFNMADSMDKTQQMYKTASRLNAYQNQEYE